MKLNICHVTLNARKYDRIFNTETLYNKVSFVSIDSKYYFYSMN